MESVTLLLLVSGVLLALIYAGYAIAQQKAARIIAGGARMHSRPKQYGWYAVVSMAIPALAVALVGTAASLLGDYETPLPLLLTAAVVLGGAGLGHALRAIRPELRARNRLDAVVRSLLLAAALISIVTTVAIVFSMLFEAIRFFNIVGFWNFVAGTEWAPGQSFLVGAGRASGDVQYQFGSLPLFAGTFMVTLIAIAVALPVGLLSAIYMAEYASPRVRNLAKPLLEILAGIPTVVYGFFAAITFSPFIVRVAGILGLDATYENMLSPGIIMGVMIVPFISSLSDDVITSIPQSLREGAYALGTTRSETIKHVLLPAALPGVISATLLGVSRALGETMIVVMAAGMLANLTANPLDTMTTVTVHIVANLTGDQAFDSPLTLSAFGLGLTLFVITLLLNIVSAVMVRRFKQKYD